jgi:hypothetical protein
MSRVETDVQRQLRARTAPGPMSRVGHTADRERQVAKRRHTEAMKAGCYGHADGTVGGKKPVS